MKVSAAGGVPQPVTTLDTKRGEVSHNWPEVLPGGKNILFQITIHDGQTHSEIVAQNLRTGARRIVAVGMHSHYVPTGHVVYVLDGVMMARPFDLRRLDVTGPAFPVGEEVMESGEGAAQFGFSRLGSLVYVPGEVGAGERQLVWVDRNGKEETTAGPARPYLTARLSSNDRRIAMSIEGLRTTGWIYENAREILTPVSSEFNVHHPVWTPDGDRLHFYQSRRPRPVLEIGRRQRYGRKANEERVRAIPFFVVARWPVPCFH